MIWVNLGLAFLKLANLVLGLVKDQQLIDAGVDKEIARNSVSILARTEIGKQIDFRAAGLTEAQVDAELKDLEPK